MRAESVITGGNTFPSPEGGYNHATVIIHYIINNFQGTWEASDLKFYFSPINRSAHLSFQPRQKMILWSH